MNTMNVSNLTYSVARATELARETGEIQRVGYLREANTFCPTLVGSEIYFIVEWWAAVDHFGLISFADEEDYAQWALSLECARNAHIAATAKSGTHHHFDGDVKFVEV